MQEEINEEIGQKDIVVVVNGRGELDFSDHIGLSQAASLAIQTRLAPPHLISEGKPAVMAALLACKQYNLPQRAMSKMAYIKGTLTFYGYLVQGLAERHRDYGDKREYFLDKNQEMVCVQNKNLKEPVWAAVVEIKKKGSSVWNQYVFTIDDAENAGLKNGVWKSYPKDMLMHKARKRALNAEYASVLEGVDYHEDVVEAIDVKASVSTVNADAFNEMELSDAE